MAPEVVNVGQQVKEGKKKRDITGYDVSCDIWSAGVVLYALLYGQMPFRGVTVREIKEKIMAAGQLNAINKVVLKDSISESA